MPKWPHESGSESGSSQHLLDGNSAWSIDSSSLTPTGQAELLKSLGRQLQTNYQGLLKEPPPDRIGQLLELLEKQRSYADDNQG